jgi:hypothetical protein
MRQGIPTQQKVRIVCNDCNNGWMSRIVDDAKPAVLALMSGGATRITPGQQKTLAAWIVLTCMTAEYIPGNSRIIPVRHRRYLMRHRLAPEDWSISLGVFVGQSGFRYDHHTSVGKQYAASSYVDRINSALETGASPNVLQSTFTVGSIFIQACTVTNNLMIINDYDRWVAGLACLVRIWPLRRFWPLPARAANWPPPESIDDRMAHILEDAFYEYKHAQGARLP